MTEQVKASVEKPLKVVKCSNGATVRIFGSCLPTDPRENQRRIQQAQAIANQILDRVARERYRNSQAKTPVG